jgi:hypothetical protein
MTSRTIATAFLLWCAPFSRADSDPTTISAQGDALSRSESAVSLTPAMPSAPPPPTSAGTPVVKKRAPRAVAPGTKAEPIPDAPSVAAPASPPASSDHVVILDSRDTPGKIIVSHGGRGPVLAAGDGLLTDRKDRHIEIVPEGAVSPREPLPALELDEPAAAAAQIPTPAIAAPAAPTKDPPAPDAARKRASPWPWILGAVAAVFAAGFLLL